MRRLLIALMLVLTAVQTALGDTAPVRALGPNVEPIDSTTVRMTEERIDIHLRRDTRDPSWYSWNAIAEYRIWFRFEPGADEHLTVGFPLFIWNEDEMVFGERAQDLRIEVDGQEVAFEIHEGEYDPYDPNADPTDWAVFPVSFRAGQPLEMTVSYWMPVPAYDKHWVLPLQVSYILRTGAYWAGTIGRAEAVLKVDKPIGEEHVLTPAGELQATTPGWVLEDGALRWVWEDLEPDFDLHVTLENPYWLDTGTDIRAMLDAGLADRDALVRALWGTLHLFEGSRVGETQTLRGGVLRQEAGEEVLPDLMAAAEAYLSEHPEDREVRNRYLFLLQESVEVWRRDPSGWVALLRSEERLAHTLRVGVRFCDAQELSDLMAYWHPWTSPALLDHPWQPETQAAIADFLAVVMPPSFKSADTAREWVAGLAGSALSPEQRDGLLAMALVRAPEAEEPGAQAEPPQEVASGNAGEPAAFGDTGVAEGSGYPLSKGVVALLVVGLCAALAVAGGGWRRC